jgi:hypothetical protein
MYVVNDLLSNIYIHNLLYELKLLFISLLAPLTDIQIIYQILY